MSIEELIAAHERAKREVREAEERDKIRQAAMRIAAAMLSDHARMLVALVFSGIGRSV